MRVKLKLISLGTFVLCILAMQSCAKDEEYYSCDKDVDQWVKHNLDEVSNMTRADWVEVGDIAYQRAIYNAFFPEQRLDLWIGKLYLTLDLFSRDEDKVHVVFLISELKSNPQWFEDSVLEADKDEFDLFIYKWNEYAVNQLDWSTQTLYSVIGTPENAYKTSSGELKIEITNIKTVNNVVKTSSEGGYGNVCDCGNGSEYLLCAGFDGYRCNVDYDSPCRQTERGCGSLWLNACWGKCQRSY